MGTNFSWRTAPCRSACEHCAHQRDIHVGKRSAGWSFGFRAYLHRLMNTEHPEWGYDEESPFGFPVESRADWRRVFTEVPGVLVNEYDEQVPDPVAWLDGLLPPDGAKRQWEAALLGLHGHASRDWRDTEGFRFYAGEFS